MTDPGRNLTLELRNLFFTKVLSEFAFDRLTCQVLKNGEENEQKKLTDCWTSAFDSTVEARESDAE